MTTVIIGGNSRLGSALFGYMRRHAEPVWWTGRRTRMPKYNADYFSYFDILDPKTWNFETGWASRVIICVGETRIGVCDDEHERTEELNVNATIRFAEWCLERNLHVVLFSSTQVFSGDKSYRKVDDEKHPCSTYGAQKLRLEHWAQEKPVAIIRMSKIISLDDPLMWQWYSTLIQGGEITPYKNYVCAPVELSWFCGIVTSISSNKFIGTYQVSGDKDISYTVLADTMWEAVNQSGFVKYVDGPNVRWRQDHTTLWGSGSMPSTDMCVMTFRAFVAHTYKNHLRTERNSDVYET
jgi:dTDP-4-dehydrorhamnose reductase